MALTDDDIARIQTVLENFATKQDLKELEQKIDDLPTRQEFLELVSEVMGEVKNEREENEIINGNVSDHTQRLENLEKIHPRGQHTAA